MRGKPLTKATLRHSINTGIQIGNLPIMVPEYHVMLAAEEANYRYYGDWTELGWKERATIVALYFAKMLVKNHNEDAQATAAQKRADQSAQT